MCFTCEALGGGGGGGGVAVGVLVNFNASKTSVRSFPVFFSS
jgi:hypothetical protein